MFAHLLALRQLLSGHLLHVAVVIEVVEFRCARNLRDKNIAERGLSSSHPVCILCACRHTSHLVANCDRLRSDCPHAPDFACSVWLLRLQ